MEILESCAVTNTAWWIVASIAIACIFLPLAIIAAFNDAHFPAALFAVIALAAIAVIIFAPLKVPTDKMSYTIEITDPTQYQILVEKGYSFKRLFENKEIYTIIGDALQ